MDMMKTDKRYKKVFGVVNDLRRKKRNQKSPNTPSNKDKWINAEVYVDTTDRKVKTNVKTGITVDGGVY